MIVLRICIATSGPGGLGDYVSPVFGRCPSFTIIDLEQSKIKNVSVVQNFASFLGSGAGVQAAQLMLNNRCNTVIAGSFGPNSSMILSMARLDMRICPFVQVEKALDLFNKGMLPPAFSTIPSYISPYTFP